MSVYPGKDDFLEAPLIVSESLQEDAQKSVRTRQPPQASSFLESHWNSS